MLAGVREGAATAACRAAGEAWAGGGQIDGPARHTPIIAMTANALPEQVRAFRQAGMDDYIAKPFKQQDLHEAIRRVVDLPLLADPTVLAVVAQAPPDAGRAACRS